MISMDLAETEGFEPSIADGGRASFDPRWVDFTFGDAVLDKNLPRFPEGRLQPQHREKVVSAASDVSSSSADFNRTAKRSQSLADRPPNGQAPPDLQPPPVADGLRRHPSDTPVYRHSDQPAWNDASSASIEDGEAALS
jgi:hypothetical protein